MSREGAEALFSMGHSASEHFANFLDFLRMTGTELPMTNAQIAGLLVDALDGAPLAEHAKETADTLARDMEVIAEALIDAEEEESDD